MGNCKSFTASATGCASKRAVFVGMYSVNGLGVRRLIASSGRFRIPARCVRFGAERVLHHLQHVGRNEIAPHGFCATTHYTFGQYALREPDRP